MAKSITLSTKCPALRAEFPQRGKEFYVKTLVKKSASIGANATIICGIEIGRYAMIAAGSIVTKNVKAYSLVLGSPARHVGWVSRAGEILGED